MLDHLIKGATVVDGTGAPARVADVGLRDGRIVVIAAPGTVTEEARTSEDATGLVLTPGFVDPHTHYDAQLFWDPYATPSMNHGVTTVAAWELRLHPGPLNPARPEDADYTRRMMSKVEGMALKALEEGVDWTWSTFGEYLDALEGRIAVNAGFMVGHCALRRHVMGEDAVGGQPTPEQLQQMIDLFHDAMDSRRLGPVHHPVLHALRRQPAPPSPPGTPGPANSSRSPRPSPNTRAPSWRRSSRAASTSSPTRRSTSSSR